jgi:hypothetical protein
MWTPRPLLLSAILLLPRVSAHVRNASGIPCAHARVALSTETSFPPLLHPLHSSICGSHSTSQEITQMSQDSFHRRVIS